MNNDETTVKILIGFSKFFTFYRLFRLSKKNTQSFSPMFFNNEYFSLNFSWSVFRDLNKKFVQNLHFPRSFSR